MIIYSVTVSIDNEILGDWRGWMLEVHIPDVMSTGCFTAYRMQRLIEPEPEPGTSTFNIQYECRDMDTYLDYRENFAPGLQEAHSARYKDRFVAFRTLLERID